MVKNMNKVKIVVNTLDGLHHTFNDKWDDEKLKQFRSHLTGFKYLDGFWLKNDVTSDTEYDMVFFNPENITSLRLIVLK